MAREPGDTRVLSEVGFVHLHVHSSYSLLEGALMVGALAKMAAADGQPALALTDTNNLFGALEFSEKLVGVGVQPIVGVQLSVDFADEAEGSRKNIQQVPPHLVLLAMNETGYGNLMKLVTEAALASGGSGQPLSNLPWRPGRHRPAQRPAAAGGRPSGGVVADLRRPALC